MSAAEHTSKVQSKRMSQPREQTSKQTNERVAQYSCPGSWLHRFVPSYSPTTEVTTVDSSNDELETYLSIMDTHGDLLSDTIKAPQATIHKHAIAVFPQPINTSSILIDFA